MYNSALWQKIIYLQIIHTQKQKWQRSIANKATMKEEKKTSLNFLIKKSKEAFLTEICKGKNPKGQQIVNIVRN